MKYKQGEVVRIIDGTHKTPTGKTPTMIGTYVGQEAIVEHVDEERKLYTIRLDMPFHRGIVRFNVVDRMIEPLVTEAMLDAVWKDGGWKHSGFSRDDLDEVYRMMSAARFKGIK